MTNTGLQLPRNFNIEVARGTVNGYESFSITAVNPTVGSSFEDLWDQGGNFVFPTGAETWEILSDSASDTSAGIGARSVIISGLDTSYVEQTETVILNGITPVVTTRTDWFRIRSVITISSGSNQTNVGSITLRVSGGGLVRSLIRVEQGQTFNGFFTVPANKSLFIESIQLVIPKNEDVVLRNKFLAFGTNTFLRGGDAPVYQNNASVEFVAIIGLPAKTDFVPTVKSTNNSVNVILQIQAKLINDAGTLEKMGTF